MFPCKFEVVSNSRLVFFAVDVMASSNDVRDIMGLERPSAQLTMDKILADSNASKKKSKKSGAPGGPEAPVRRPEGMARELYNLLYNDSKDAPPIIPTDSGLDKGYRHVKAKLGMRKVSQEGRVWRTRIFPQVAPEQALVCTTV